MKQKDQFTTIIVKFAKAGNGPVLSFRARQKTSPGFVQGLRDLGASPATIAAAEGRIDEVKRLRKALV